MQETIYDLEERVWSNKQQGLEKEKEFAAKLREMDNAVDKLRYDLKALQSQAEGLKDDMDRKMREFAAMRNIGDWDAKRRRYETISSSQREEISSLQNRLQDLNVDGLGYSHASDEPPSTQKLRTEFRKMVAKFPQMVHWTLEALADMP
ncbi:hypothetical protein HDU76_007262 [Blyttiomyces sp. JEL0837]|nr:hypothetical protein HDU76_007262 [Blyttiomyces sp. JEL0837]